MTLARSLGLLLKDQEDLARVEREAEGLLVGAGAEG